jgi:hypothetical protein
MCSDAINYAIVKGGQNVTVYPYKAISKSPSQITYQIQVPNETTIIDRKILMTNTFVLKITGTPASGDYLIKPGSTDCLAPFPSHQLFSTIQCTINNNTVNLNCQDVLNGIIRQIDSRELSAYNSTCPTQYDVYGKYSDAVGATNSPFNSFSESSLDGNFVPRGAFPVEVGTSYTGGVLSGTLAVNGTTAYVRFTTTEPLLQSPWIFGKALSNGAGIYGVQNMAYQFNLGQANRVWRSASSGQNGLTVELVAVEDSQIVLNYLTPHPSDLLPARNVVPHYTMERYINPIGSVPVGTNEYNSQSLQLNQVPDKLIIFLRKTLSAQRADTPDAVLPIEGISINFNNQSGLLSSATSTELFKYSREAGSNQTWSEFGGKAWKNGTIASASTVGDSIATAGSFLMLEFGRHIQLSDEFYAPGSIGNFNCQYKVKARNDTASALADYELVTIVVNSGLMVLERGSTSVYTAVLTKQDVMDSVEMEPTSLSQAHRMIGGGFLDSFKSVLGYLPSIGRVAKSVMKEIPHPYTQKGAEILGSLGMGRSGGGPSGGRLHKRLA